MRKRDTSSEIQNTKKKKSHSINFKVTCTIGALSPEVKIKTLKHLFILTLRAKAYTCNRLKAWTSRLKDVLAMKAKLSHFIIIKWECNRFFFKCSKKNSYAMGNNLRQENILKGSWFCLLQVAGIEDMKIKGGRNMLAVQTVGLRFCLVARKSDRTSYCMQTSSLQPCPSASIMSGDLAEEEKRLYVQEETLPALREIHKNICGQFCFVF